VISECLAEADCRDQADIDGDVRGISTSCVAERGTRVAWIHLNRGCSDQLVRSHPTAASGGAAEAGRNSATVGVESQRQTGSGSIDYINGIAKVRVKASRGNYTLTEEFDGRDGDSSPALQYKLHRGASFDTKSGQMIRAVTTFVSQVPTPTHVTVTVRSVSVQEAVAIAGGK
jgi:hypothetical protein